MNTCAHCGGTKLMIQARGLCSRCYTDRKVRKLYKRGSTGTTKGVRSEPSTRQLEAMIAEQMANLPAWWNNDAK